MGHIVFHCILFSVARDGLDDADASRRSDEDEFEALCLEQGLLTEKASHTPKNPTASPADYNPNPTALFGNRTTFTWMTAAPELRLNSEESLTSEADRSVSDESSGEDFPTVKGYAPGCQVPTATDAEPTHALVPHMTTILAQPAPATPAQPPREKKSKSPTRTPKGKQQASPARPPRPSERSQRLFAERRSTDGAGHTTSSASPVSVPDPPVGNCTNRLRERYTTVDQLDAFENERETPSHCPPAASHTPSPVTTDTSQEQAEACGDMLDAGERNTPTEVAILAAPEVSLRPEQTKENTGSNASGIGFSAMKFAEEASVAPFVGAPPVCSCHPSVEEYKIKLQVAEERIQHLEDLVEKLSLGASYA